MYKIRSGYFVDRAWPFGDLYATSLISTLWPFQNAVNLNLWRKPEVSDAIRDFIT